MCLSKSLCILFCLNVWKSRNIADLMPLYMFDQSDLLEGVENCVWLTERLSCLQDIIYLDDMRLPLHIYICLQIICILVECEIPALWYVPNANIYPFPWLWGADGILCDKPIAMVFGFASSFIFDGEEGQGLDKL